MLALGTLVLLSSGSAAPTDFTATKQLSWFETNDNCVSATAPGSQKRIEVWTFDRDVTNAFGHSNVHVKTIRLFKHDILVKSMSHSFYLFFNDEEAASFEACAETGNMPVTLGIRFSNLQIDEM